MKRKIFAVVCACLISAIVLGYGIFKLVDNSTHYLIEVTIDKGDNQLQVVTLEAGDTILMPNSLTKEGATFKGWYLDKEGKEPFDPATKIRYNTTIYAVWEEQYK